MPKNAETLDAVVCAARALRERTYGRLVPMEHRELEMALDALDAPERDETLVAVPRWALQRAAESLNYSIHPHEGQESADMALRAINRAFVDGVAPDDMSVSDFRHALRTTTQA